MCNNSKINTPKQANSNIIIELCCSFLEVKEDTALVDNINSNLQKITQFLLVNNFLPNDILDKKIQLSLVLTNDENIAKINQDWRQKNQSTNVLSMAMFDFDEEDVSSFEIIPLGDIVISLETAANEAKQDEINEFSHILRLFIHGLLHILGMDHGNDDDAQKMQAAEDKILTTLGEEVSSLTSNYWK